MTGHLNGTGEAGNVNQRNQQIRNWCAANNKILYDFADVESYDPDGLVNYMQLGCNDNCDYSGGNWALDWQATHTQNVDWYACSPAHSQALNGNRKAYAAWWMFARIAGWDGSPEPTGPTFYPHLRARRATPSPSTARTSGPPGPSPSEGQTPP